MEEKSRPPYIRFERRAVEDRAASTAAGHYVARDVDYAVLMRPGSRDTVEKLVSDLIAEWQKKARDGVIPTPWAIDLEKGYEYWKKGEEPPPNGTPIKGWPVLSPGQQATVIGAGVLTVEDLAQLPDGQLGVVGINAVSFKQKANAWLVAAKDSGKLVQENAELKGKVESLETALAAMKTAIEELKAAKK